MGVRHLTLAACMLAVAAASASQQVPDRYPESVLYEEFE